MLFNEFRFFLLLCQHLSHYSCRLAPYEMKKKNLRRFINEYKFLGQRKTQCVRVFIYFSYDLEYGDWFWLFGGSTQNINIESLKCICLNTRTLRLSFYINWRLNRWVDVAAFRAQML